jgi:hypothetical protein
MTRRVDFDEWQRMRATIAATQTRILVGAEAPATERLAELPAGRPAEGRPLHSHRPRSDEEWMAIEDGVRALLAARVSSGRWRQTAPRRVVIG